MLDQKLRRVRAEIKRNRRVLQMSVKRWSLEAAAGLPLSPVPHSELEHSSISGPPPSLDGRFACGAADAIPGAEGGLPGGVTGGGAWTGKAKKAGGACAIDLIARPPGLALLHSIPEETGQWQHQPALRYDVRCVDAGEREDTAECERRGGAAGARPGGAWVEGQGAGRDGGELGSGGGRRRRERGRVTTTRKLEAGVHTLRGSRHKVVRRS
jgi:hypothetical protein